MAGARSRSVCHFSDKYGMYTYQGNLFNRLDPMVRYLEAIEAVARVLGREKAAKEAEGGEGVRLIKQNFIILT